MSFVAGSVIWNERGCTPSIDTAVPSIANINTILAHSAGWNERDCTPSIDTAVPSIANINTILAHSTTWNERDCGTGALSAVRYVDTHFGGVTVARVCHSIAAAHWIIEDTTRLRNGLTPAIVPGDPRQALGLFEGAVLTRTALVGAHETPVIPGGHDVGVAVAVGVLTWLVLALAAGGVAAGTFFLLGAALGISALVTEIIWRSRLVAVIGLRRDVGQHIGADELGHYLEIGIGAFGHGQCSVDGEGCQQLKFHECAAIL